MTLFQSSNNPRVGRVMLQKSTFTRKAYFTWKFLQTMSTTALYGEVCIQEPRYTPWSLWCSKLLLISCILPGKESLSSQHMQGH